MTLLTLDLPRHTSLIDRAYVIVKAATTQSTGGVTLSDLCNMLHTSPGRLWPEILTDDRFIKPNEYRTVSRVNPLIEVRA